jgi:hypothetical protein
MTKLLAGLVTMAGLIGSCAPLYAQISSTPEQSYRLQRVDLFADARPYLESKTTIPLRLPSVPLCKGCDPTELYARIVSADASGYEIELTFDPKCEGAHACHYGTLVGVSQPLASEEGHKIPVMLMGGIHATFVEATCGASCDDSEITWREGNYSYLIAIKAERRETLIRIANSTLAGKSK